MGLSSSWASSAAARFNHGTFLHLMGFYTCTTHTDTNSFRELGLLSGVVLKYRSLSLRAIGSTQLLVFIVISRFLKRLQTVVVTVVVGRDAALVSKGSRRNSNDDKNTSDSDMPHAYSFLRQGQPSGLNTRDLVCSTPSAAY